MSFRRLKPAEEMNPTEFGRIYRPYASGPYHGNLRAELDSLCSKAGFLLNERDTLLGKTSSDEADIISMRGVESMLPSVMDSVGWLCDERYTCREITKGWLAFDGAGGLNRYTNTQAAKETKAVFEGWERAFKRLMTTLEIIGRPDRDSHLKFSEKGELLRRAMFVTMVMCNTATTGSEFLQAPSSADETPPDLKNRSEAKKWLENERNSKLKFWLADCMYTQKMLNQNQPIARSIREQRRREWAWVAGGLYEKALQRQTVVQTFSDIDEVTKKKQEKWIGKVASLKSQVDRWAGRG